MILVICAVAQELRGFARSGVDVVAVGIGPVEAAAATARALARGSYRLAINAGIAGGFRGRCAVGDAIAVADDRYVDIGLENGAELALPGGARLAERAVSDEALLRAYRAAVPGGRSGAGITSATVTTTEARARLLDHRYAPDVESMEGFAVLRAAALAGVPALEVRGISNLVGDRAASEWDFRAGSQAAVRAVRSFLDAVEIDA